MSIEEEDHSFHLPPPTPSHIRSHSLKPQHSRIDYARRKSATELTGLESSTDEDRLEELKKSPSSSWLKRRFTFFSLEQPIDENRRVTTNERFSIFNEKAYSDLLKQKRPSIIAQMMEVDYLPRD